MISRSFLDGPGRWNLDAAKQLAEEVIATPQKVSVLVRALYSDDEELRRRAADTARRVTERRPELLFAFADRIIGVFSESQGDDWRTRAHLGLVAARIAQARPQRLRVAGLLRPLLHDPGNVVRCTALEGLSLVAAQEPSLRAAVEPELEAALLTGTLAMQNRARYALARLAKAERARR